jgi:hypothetical protein
MIQTHLYITQTYLDLDKLYQLIAREFFNSGSLPDFKKDITLSEFTDWRKYQDRGQIILPHFDKKEDFRESQMSFEQHFAEPTLLFLGDVSTYSLALQEGMLKLLEEPVPHLTIVLTSHDVASLLETITSRARLHYIPRTVVHQILNQELLEKTKKNLPPIGDSLKQLLKGTFELPDLKKVEREEIDFWLWQLSCYAEEVLKSQSNSITQDLLHKILMAQKLNHDNTQKKFALDYLRV